MRLTDKEQRGDELAEENRKLRSEIDYLKVCPKAHCLSRVVSRALLPSLAFPHSRQLDPYLHPSYFKEFNADHTKAWAAILEKTVSHDVPCLKQKATLHWGLVSKLKVRRDDSVSPRSQNSCIQCGARAVAQQA